MQPFRDRHEAGRMLAAKLTQYTNDPDSIVLALPRGGIPVGYEIARLLNIPLDVFVVRKLGVPGHEELAMGAIASGGTGVINSEVVRNIPISGPQIHDVMNREQQELARREQTYRQQRPAFNVAGQHVILVDDGMATGSTMRAAATALHQQKPATIIVAIPVASPQACDLLQPDVDEIVCALMPAQFESIGSWYRNFDQLTDETVQHLLQQARQQNLSHAEPA
jgi:predicted phosphoribosyltransferase